MVNKSIQNPNLGTKNIAPEQSRAARALLDWSQTDLAKAASVSKQTLVDFERGARTPYDRTLADIRSALESAGVEFIPENGGGAGIRRRKPRQDRANLDQHIERLEGEVAHLKPSATGKPSPATGMAMLRRGRAKSDLAKAKNKRAKGAPK
jgi:DNA-binding XRE family transcriptional regulator